MPSPDPLLRRKYNENYYYRNGGKAKVMERNKANRVKKAAYVTALKQNPCTDCDVEFPPIAMEFDHIGSDKIAAVSKLVTDNASLERIKAEIAKCELVCANCHAIRTGNRYLHLSPNGMAPGS